MFGMAASERRSIMRRTGAKGGHSRMSPATRLSTGESNDPALGFLGEAADEFHRRVTNPGFTVPYCMALWGGFFLIRQIFLGCYEIPLSHPRPRESPLAFGGMGILQPRVRDGNLAPAASRTSGLAS